MWNQGNGNGNGYGQGPRDAYDRCDNAKPISNRDPYIEEGQHTLAVISIEEFQSEQGVADRARFEVLESSTMRPGTVVGAVWFIEKPSPKPGMVTDADRFADFCARLKGAPAGYPIGRDIRVLVRERAAEQLARGMVIRAFGVKKIAKTTGKSFIVVNWTNVEQTPQQIAEMRAKIEAKGLVQENRGTGGGQYQGAPHPSQMQQQYPAQQAQQGYQMQQGQWAPPQGAQIAQVPAQGGYLANVDKPQGGGGQGTW